MESAAGPPPRAVATARRDARREWISKAVFEGMLVALSVVAALAVNEWRDSRERENRVRDALVAMRAELQANRSELGRVTARNATILDAIPRLTAAGRIYEGGILVPIELVATAWESTRAGAITNDMALPTLMVLGRAYEAQSSYEREIAAFNDSLLRTGAALRRDPDGFAGIISDLDRHARRLDELYAAALQLPSTN